MFSEAKSGMDIPRVASLWARGATLIRALLPFQSPPLIAAANLKKMVMFVKTKTEEFPIISLETWLQVAVKMQISAEMAKTYFELSKDLQNGDNSPPSQKGIEGKAKVSLMEFGLVLYLQSIERPDKSASFRAFETRFPGMSRKSFPPADAETTRTALLRPDKDPTENYTESRVREFLRNNIGKILDLLAMNDISVQDYHMTPPRGVVDSINLSSLEPLNLLLEGAIASSSTQEPTNTLTCTEVLRIPEVKCYLQPVEGRVSLERLETLLINLTSEDPFGLVSCAPLRALPRTRHSHLTTTESQVPQGYLGVSKSDQDHQVCLASNIAKKAVVKTNSSIDGCFLKISQCRSSQLYFTSSFKSVTVENCRECLIVVGPARHVIRVQNCVDCRIVAVTRRLIVSESSGCELYVKSGRRPIFLGGVRGLILAPFHTWWVELEEQIRSADLSLEPDFWDQPVQFRVAESRRSSVATQMGEDSLDCGWQLQDPEDFFPLTLPLESPDTPSNPPHFRTVGELPEPYRKAMEKKRKFLFDTEIQIRALPEDMQTFVRQELKKHFQAHLLSSGLGEELEQLRQLELSKAKKQKRLKLASRTSPGVRKKLNLNV